MVWTVETLNETVEAELPADMRARLVVYRAHPRREGASVD
jgi:hypothetical protein